VQCRRAAFELAFVMDRKSVLDRSTGTTNVGIVVRLPNNID
jgi:hypothetical protein